MLAKSVFKKVTAAMPKKPSVTPRAKVIEPVLKKTRLMKLREHIDGENPYNSSRDNSFLVGSRSAKKTNLTMELRQQLKCLQEQLQMTKDSQTQRQSDMQGAIESIKSQLQSI
jgi:hypothetical protein